MLSPEPIGRVRAPTRTRTPRVPPATPARVERASWLAPSRSRDALLSWGARCVRECVGIGRREPDTSFSRVAAGRRLADCRFLGPAAHARESHDGLAQRSARWRTYPWGRWNYSRRDPATRVSACDWVDARTTCRKSSAWPRRASFLRARLDGGAPTFFRAYLKWFALRLSLTDSASLSYPKTARAGNRAADARTNPALCPSARPTARYDADAVLVPPREDLSRDATLKDPLLALRKVIF